MLTSSRVSSGAPASFLDAISARSLFGFHDKRVDDILACNLAHRHAVFEDHSHTSTKGDAELRIVCFAGSIDGATHNRKMQRLFHMGQPPFYLGNNLDEVVHIKTTAGRASHDRDAARTQPERLHNLPGDAHFLLGVRPPARRESCHQCLHATECPDRLTI